MSLDRISDERLFQYHPKDEVKNWCRSLRYFHFMRARSGHSCEGDSFAVHFIYHDRADLLFKLSQIRVVPDILGKDIIIFDPFASYSIDELDKIRYPIPGHNDLQQIGDTSIFGYKVHIWVQKNIFEISISGLGTDNAYEVSDRDFQACLALEKEFDKLSWHKYLDKEVEQHAHCISREKYPELFE